MDGGTFSQLAWWTPTKSAGWEEKNSAEEEAATKKKKSVHANTVPHYFTVHPTHTLTRDGGGSSLTTTSWRCCCCCCYARRFSPTTTLYDQPLSLALLTHIGKCCPARPGRCCCRCHWTSKDFGPGSHWLFHCPSSFTWLWLLGEKGKSERLSSDCRWLEVGVPNGTLDVRRPLGGGEMLLRARFLSKRLFWDAALPAERFKLLHTFRSALLEVFFSRSLHFLLPLSVCLPFFSSTWC